MFDASMLTHDNLSICSGAQKIDGIRASCIQGQRGGWTLSRSSTMTTSTRRRSFDKRLWWNFQVMSLSCKLFVVSFINTALLTLLTYANFTGTLSSCTFGRVSDA